MMEFFAKQRKVIFFIVFFVLTTVTLCLNFKILEIDNDKISLIGTYFTLLALCLTIFFQIEIKNQLKESHQSGFISSIDSAIRDIEDLEQIKDSGRHEKRVLLNRLNKDLIDCQKCCSFEEDGEISGKIESEIRKLSGWHVDLLKESVEMLNSTKI